MLKDFSYRNGIKEGFLSALRKVSLQRKLNPNEF